MDPTLLRFDPYRLVKYVNEVLCNGRFDYSLPGTFINSSLDLAIIRQQKLHCLCHRPYIHGHTVTCSVCANHYHANCVSMQYDSYPTVLWQGPCCADPQRQSQSRQFVPDPQDEELVATSVDYNKTSYPIRVPPRIRRSLVRKN